MAAGTPFLVGQRIKKKNHWEFTPKPENLDGLWRPETSYRASCCDVLRIEYENQPQVDQKAEDLGNSWKFMEILDQLFHQTLCH